MTNVASLHRQMFEAVEAHDWPQLEDLFHPNYTYVSTEGDEQTAADSLAMAMGYVAAFSDLSFEITHQHTAGSISVIEILATGTHDGELMGIAPTGRWVTLPVCNVVEERDGKIYCEREYFDRTALMAQLGVDGDETSMRDHQAIVRSIYEAFGRGDVEFILARLAEDVAWDAETHNWGLPWYQPRSGKAGARSFFETVGKELEFKVFEPVAMLASNDEVASVIRLEVLIKSTGRTVQDTEVHLFRFDDMGLITSFAHVVDQHAQLMAYESESD